MIRPLLAPALLVGLAVLAGPEAGAQYPYQYHAAGPSRGRSRPGAVRGGARLPAMRPGPRRLRLRGGRGLFGLGGRRGSGGNGYGHRRRRPWSRSPFPVPSTYRPLADPTARGGMPANPYLGPNRLPRGQVFYGGRFFGSFNDRFYGPQYGYF